jgi:hypothetical protein
VFLNVKTEVKYLLMFYTCYFVKNGIYLHQKRYCIFALEQSISRVIIYFSEECDSGWNITQCFGSRFYSHLQFLFFLPLTYLVIYFKKYKFCQ